MTPLDFDPDVTPDRLEELKRKLDDGQLMAFESRHRRKDGAAFPVEIRGQAFWEGGRCFTVALARDFTERERAEAALRESEERFRGTFENASVGIAHKDLAGRFLRVNPKFCDIVGYTREELLTMTWRDITDPADLAASLASYARLMSGESPSFSLEKRYLRKDQSSAWVNLSVSLQRDQAGSPAYAIAMVQDISERKRLEAELRQASDRLVLRGARLECPASGTTRCRTVTTGTAARHYVNLWEQLGYEGPLSLRGTRTERGAPGRPRPCRGCGEPIPGWRDHGVRNGSALAPQGRLLPHHALAGRRGARRRRQADPLRGRHR